MSDISLDGKQLQMLHNGLLEAFDYSIFKQFLMFEMNTSLEKITGNNADLSTVVFDVLISMRKTGRMRELIEKAVRERPENSTLKLVAGMVDVQQVQQGVHLIPGQLSDPVRAAVHRSWDSFRSAGVQIEILVNYKYVHDLLHDLEYGCYNLILTNAEAFPEALACSNLDLCARLIRQYYDRACDLTLTATQRKNDIIDITTELQKAGDHLECAVKSRNKLPVQEAIQSLNYLIGNFFPNFNKYLNQAANDLRLDDLRQALEEVHGVILRTNAHPGLAEQSELSLHSIISLRESLDRMIVEHDRWQRMDDLLRLIKNSRDRSLGEIRDNWARVRVLGDRLREEFGTTPRGLAPWAQWMAEEATVLDAALGEGSQEEVFQAFDRYRQIAASQFYDVDKNLSRLCNRLKGLGQTLTDLLSKTH